MSQQGRLVDLESSLETLTGNTGGAVPPDAAGNIDILGSAPITVAGNPGTNTLTIDTDGTLAITYTEDTGTATAAADNLNVFGDATQGSVTSGAGSTITITNSDASETQKGVLEISTDAESIAGTATNVAVVPSSLAAKLGTQTANGIAYGAGTAAALGWTSEPSDGQLIIGATGAPPAAASLTSSGGTITVTPGANTLNIDTDGSIAVSYTTDSGSAVPAAGVLQVLGGTNMNTAGATNVVTINLDTTLTGLTSVEVGDLTLSGGTIATSALNHDITLDPHGSGDIILETTAGGDIQFSGYTQNALIYFGASGVIEEVGPLTDGQLLIGSTGGSPAAASLTAGVGIAITGGSNSITLDAIGGGIDWNVETGTTANLVANNGYIGNNASGVTFTLPATAAVGEIYRVTGLQASWTIDQNASQTIHFGNDSTTTGVGGSLASTNARDAVEIVCVIANTDFQVLSSIGNITVT